MAPGKSLVAVQTQNRKVAIMDVTKQKEQLAKLEKQVRDLAAKEAQVRARLDGEQQIVRAAASARATALGKLSDANAEEAVRLNKEVDVLDARIKNAERLSEAHQASLRQIAAEVQSVTKERDVLGLAISAQENAVACEQWKLQVVQARIEVEQKCAEARLALAALDQLCASGGAKFGGIAFSVAAAEFEGLLVRQANLEQNGWKLSTPIYRADAIIHIRGLVRR